MVVMDRDDYNYKAHQLLSDAHTYKPIPKDLTKILKNKLAQTLRDINTQGGPFDSKYKRLYPTSVVAPKLYSLPRIHKSGTPLRPIISSRGSITYGTLRELANIFHPLVGQSPHLLKNTQHFVEHIKKVNLEPGVHGIL